VSTSTCIDCGATFERDAEWKVRCASCWGARKRSRSGDPVHERLRAENAALRAELEALRRAPAIPPRLVELLPRLLQIAHPDKHGNSRAANEVTRELLALRARVRR